MADEHWQESLSEETRHMISEQSAQIWKNFFDEISYKPARITKEQQRRIELGKRMRLIAVDLELSGEEADARVLMLAAEELMRR